MIAVGRFCHVAADYCFLWFIYAAAASLTLFGIGVLFGPATQGGVWMLGVCLGNGILASLCHGVDYLIKRV